MATTNAWAQKPVYNNGTWYSFYKSESFNIHTIDSKEFSVFAPTDGKLTFDWEYDGWIFPSHTTKIFESSDNGGNYFEKGQVSGTKKGTGNVTLSTNINKIKFDRQVGNTNNVYYTNVKLSLAKHILLESGTYGTSSITVTDGNLATAEGYTSTNKYQVKLRSFLASGNIKMTSSNPEFHFEGGVTEVYLGVDDNYCASANGSGSCTNASTLGHISSYYKDVYFSPSVQYNTKARSTTITITDGVNTAYVYLTAPVIPTYYFKAEAIAEPTTAGVATATFVNGQSTYSLVAPNVGTNSMSAEVTFAASAGANSVFEGWKKVAEDTYYKQGSGTESFKETITSSVLDPRGMASQKTYRAIFSERYTASMETNDISGLKVGGSATAVYSFINTSAAIPSSDENADFHYVITHRPDNTTKNGSADASKVVSFDPSTKQVVGLNSGSATITFVQKQNATHEYVAKSFEVTVEKNAIDAWIVRGDAVLNELVENAFSVTDGLQDYSVESLNSSIAEYVAGNKIQTYFTEGTAQFRVTRDEDYKYVGLNELFDLEVKKSGDVCYLVENASTSVDHEFGKNSDGTYSEVYTLNGIGDKLNFMCKLSDNADAEHYLVAQYSTSDTGDFYDLTGSYVSTKKDNEHVLNGLTLPEGTKRICFKRTAQTIGTKNFSIYNIYVTRKKDLTPQIDGDIFYLTQVASGIQFAGTFPLLWSTCCDNIRFSCDNPNFVIKALDSNNQLQDYIDASTNQGTTNLVVTYFADTNNPDLTGTLTIYDQSQSKTITLSCEQLLQTIDWPQYFYNIEADEDGNIHEDFSLNAVARTVNGQPTNRLIHYTLAVEPADKAHLSTDVNGITHLIITGVCEGFITASVDEFTDEKGKRYSASQLTRDIRVRKAGEPCNTLALRVFDQYSTHGWGTNYIVFPIGDLPQNTMTFGAHAEVGSLNNWLDVNFHMDANAAPNASGWTEKQRLWINAADKYTWGYEVKVPENAKQVRFEAGSSLTTYINMVRIYQQEYLTANVERIELPNAIVNQQFSTTFEVEYSAVPFIQYHVTNNNNLNLQLIPSPEITNNCKDHGTYTFTLKGMSPYPQTKVEELITIFTSAGHKVEIPVFITSSLSDTYYFDQNDGNWDDLNNWRVKDATPTKLPTASNPVVVSKAMTINEGELVAYSVAIEESGSVNIQPKGGLTLHAGGFTEGVTKDNFTIENNKDGVGYVRVSPYFINKVPGTMPDITVQYTTRAKAGGAKDQVWQYVGAPGKNMQMSNDGVMVYLWSETDGWVYSNTNMTPFEGYALTRTAEGAETYSIVAQLIHADQTITLTKTDNGGMNGDNLFVNSYLAPIDLTKFTDIDDALNDPNDDFRGDFEKTFYLFNSGSWNDWQGENGEGANKILEDESAPGQYYAITPLGAALIDAQKDQTTLPPMQGVYVVAKGEAQIHLKYNKHVFTSASRDMNRPMRAPQIKDENFMRVRMQVNSQNSGADRMYVIQYENTTRGYDNGYDAKNIIAQGQANIYTNEPEGQMEISIADQIDSTFIGFAAGEDSEYTLTFTSLVGQDMYLHDLESDSLFLITEEGQYTFSAHPNSVNDMRFQLLLYPDFSDDLPGNGVTTGIDNLVSSAQVWVNDKRVYIADAPQNSKLVVYTANGMCITSPLTIHHTPCTIDLSHLPTGVYVLRLNNQAYKLVCK